MSSLKELENSIAAEGRKKGFDKPPKLKKVTGDDNQQGKSSKSDLSTAQILIQTIEDEYRLFHTPADEAWAVINDVCYPVGGKMFKRKLQGTFYNGEGKPPNHKAVKQAIEQAEFMALFEAPQEDVHIRVAKNGDRITVDGFGYYIDIVPGGYKSNPRRDAHFWQPKAGLQQVEPARGKDGIELLRKYLNYDCEDDFMLLVSWLLAAYNPGIACPILTLQGEQGSAKSTVAKIMRSLVDPSDPSVISAPRDVEDLYVEARGSWVVSIDNLSGVQKWLSDGFCKVCTGSGFSGRERFADIEKNIYRVSRPIILNGIDDIATRGDLLSRSIVLGLPSIDPGNQMTEGEFWGAFNRDKPYILSAIFDALSAGLAADDPQIKQLPRMADYGEWVTRCEEGLPWEMGATLRAYNENKQNAIQTGLDGEYLAVGVQEILKHNAFYEGSGTELVEKLRDVSPESSHKFLPTTHTLKKRLRRLGPALREVGITWDYDPNGDQRTYILEKEENEDEFNKRVDSYDETPF